MTESEHANGIPEVAFRKGFHRMVANDMGRECRAMLDACPTCDFEGLEAGKSYCYKPSSGATALVVVGQTTPKRRQAVASVNQGEPRRIYRGDYYGRFIELGSDLRALDWHHPRNDRYRRRGRRHGSAAGSPPAVPDPVCRNPGAVCQRPPTAAERVTQSLSRPFPRAPVSIADIDAWIAHAHESIASLRCERTRRVALNPDTAGDYDQYLDEYRNDIDYYRWLRKLVDVGGVFHVPAPAA